MLTGLFGIKLLGIGLLGIESGWLVLACWERHIDYRISISLTELLTESACLEGHIDHGLSMYAPERHIDTESAGMLRRGTSITKSAPEKHIEHGIIIQGPERHIDHGISMQVARGLSTTESAYHGGMCMLEAAY